MIAFSEVYVIESIIYEDNDIILLTSGDVNTLNKMIVCFSPIIAAGKLNELNVGTVFGYSFFSKHPLFCVYVIPKWNHWYELEYEKKILSAILHLKGQKKVWTYGVSMGGYGALKYSYLLSAEGVLSICPQASVIEEQISFENRWAEYLPKVLIHYVNWLDNYELPSNCYILYDPKSKLDSLHVNVIEKYHQNIIKVPITFAGHAVAGVLSECGMLSKTVIGIISEEFDIETFESEFKVNRLSSPGIYTGLANLLRSKGHLKLSLLFSNKALELRNSNLRLRKDRALSLQSVYAYCDALIANGMILELISFVKLPCEQHCCYDFSIELSQRYNKFLKIAEISMEKKSIILGPYVHRLNKFIKDTQVDPSVIEDFTIYGKGGMPFWSNELLELVNDGQCKCIYLFIGDIRFGNKVLLMDAQRGNIDDSYLGITSSLISAENDYKMYLHCKRGINIWREKFSNVKFILWDGFYNNVIKKVRMLDDVKLLNSKPFIETDPINSENFEDLSFLLSHVSPEDLNRLFVDNAPHPSYIGSQFFVQFIIKGKDILESLNYALCDFETRIIACANALTNNGVNPVLLIGSGVWINLLIRCLGLSGQNLLIENGLYLHSLDSEFKFLQNQSIDFCNLSSSVRVCIVSSDRKNSINALDKLFNVKNSDFSNLANLDWENANIIDDVRTIQKIHEGIDGVVNLSISEDLIDTAGSKIPSIFGLEALLNFIGANNLSRYPQLQFKLHNDVLITNSGLAYLIGGNHSVLNYTTAMLSPSMDSFKNFTCNIIRRKEHAEQHGAKYRHVVFPDKQSVLRKNFPIKPVTRLGELYINNISDDLVNYVLYPANKLELNDEASVYLPLDTHMTDFGSNEMLGFMLKSFDFLEADNIIKHIKTRINKVQDWPGDLGNKFTPPLRQQGKLLHPDWDILDYKSPGGFNDGMVDIVLNNQACYNNTILLFGDSFFRMMLKHFSYVFSRVICLRTRFYHNEMVELIKPDYIISGNAERYLSNVSSDLDANPFMLYQAIRGADDNNNDYEFLNVYRALLTPDSTYSKNYFSN